MKSLVSSSDDNASDQETNTKMDKYGIYSNEKVYELKNSGYMKKKIISAIKKSLKTNNNKHALTLNDVLVSEEKEIGNGCRQSLNIRIALDDTLLYSSRDAAPINIETFKLNDATPKSKCSHCSDRERCKGDDEWPAYFMCVKCARKEKRKWYHDNCKEKCCTTTSIHCDNCLRFKLTSNDHNFEVLDNKFSKYMYVVTCPNGGGMSLHMDYERIMHLTEEEQKFIAKEFLKEAFKEDKKGFAQFTIAIVHNGSSYMPDLLKLLAELHPSLPVQTTKLKCNTETEVMDLGSYYNKVKETYSNGTFSFNPLNEIQAASVKNGECGAYLPELLSLLEKSAFLSQVLPWSDMTTKRFRSPHESDDGPIFWCRPGEQIVSLDRNSKRNRWNADEIESFLKERQQNLKEFCEKRYIVEELKKYRRSYSNREFLFEDRTRPHADQVWGNHFEPTAAVGVIQAIHPDEIPEQNRACKEIVVFHAKHFEMLEALLHIDVTAAPKQQCAEWLDDAKLNMIRQMNIRYSKLHLYDNDIYFIPRKIVHQFKTISATLSVAWHTRLIEYYLEPDPPPVPEIKTEEQASEHESDSDSSSSSSSDSIRRPAAKKPTTTPKKKRKLSCNRSTDTEATPRKKIKPRSRSGTPQKAAVAEKTPKKKIPKTPKKALVLEEPKKPEKRSPSPASQRCATPPTETSSTKAAKKSQSRSPKRSDDTSSGTSAAVVADSESKKKKRRSRSKSRKRSDDKDRKADADKKKKKRDKSRSRSPKKREKSKDESVASVSKETSNASQTDKKNSGSTSSTSKKHDSEKRHKHRDKDKSHRSDKSSRKSSTSLVDAPKQPPSLSSTALQEVKMVAAAAASLSEPTVVSSGNTERSFGSLSTEKRPSSPSLDRQTNDSSSEVCEQSDEFSSAVSHPVTETVPEEVPLEPVPYRSPPRITDLDTRWLKKPVTPPPPVDNIKREPFSPGVAENGPVPVEDIVKTEPEIVPEPETVETPPETITNTETTAATPKEPEATTVTVKEEAISSPKAREPETVAKIAREPTKKPTAGDARSKDHRKEKLWDTPLFMPQDCDKYVLTKRPTAGSNSTTKNGDKIVKQKMLNSMQKSDKEGQISKSPPPPTTTFVAESKKHVRDDSKKIETKKIDKDKSTASEKQHHREKDRKTEYKHKEARKDRERSVAETEKKKSSESYTKEKTISSADKSSKIRNETDKRKRSGTPDKSHHKHSKKHKKHRSRSRERSGIESPVTKTPVSTDNTLDEGAEKDAELAACYNLKIPRVEIVDIGPALKSSVDTIETESGNRDEYDDGARTQHENVSGESPKQPIDN